MLEPRSNKNSGVSTKMQRESGGGACARPQLQTTHLRVVEPWCAPVPHHPTVSNAH